LSAGSYRAKVLSRSITETKKGDPQATVVFEVLSGAKSEKITWYGSFSEKAQKYTIQNLLTLGLQGNNPSGQLEIGREVEIVVDTEPDDEGRERTKVKYINKIGAIRNAMSPEMAKAKLAALEGAVAAARNNSKDKHDDIPF
jgi:hypothetical protein